MKTLKYNEKFKIRTYDASFNRMASPVSILGYLEEVATNHAQKIGLGYHDSKTEGYYWILRSSKFELTRLPELNEELTVYTWPAGLKGLKALRRFSLHVGEEEIGSGYHCWLMMSISRKKPIIARNFTEIMNEMPISDEDRFKLNKIQMPIDLEFSYKKVVMPRDIDWNMHVNNVRYADIVYNALPIEVHKEAKILSFHIDYLKECKLNDEIDIFYKREGNTAFIEGKKDSVSMFKTILELSD
jgi:acyl-ACP thioesterase